MEKRKYCSPGEVFVVPLFRLQIRYVPRKAEGSQARALLTHVALFLLCPSPRAVGADFLSCALTGATCVTF